MTSLAGLLGALLLKPALVLAAAAALVGCLRRQSAAARHAVWAGAVLASLALPVLSGVLPPLRISSSLLGVGRSLRWAELPAAAIPKDNAMLPAVPGTQPRADRSDRVQRGALVSEGGLVAAFLTLWILGTVLLAARRIVAEVRVRRIVRRARHVSDPRLQGLFSAIARASGVRRQVQLRASGDVSSPAVAGVFRPVVLLPAGAVGWSEAELSQVLHHELGHVARRDCLFNLFGDVISAVYWGNPTARWAVRRMRAEAESACDDLVLQGGAEPEGYAQLLLGIARRARSDGGLPSAATAMARPHELESRLLAVLDPRVPRGPLPRWMRPALCGLVLLFALPTAAFTLHAAAPAPSTPAGIEPDRRADSLAAPGSERLPQAADPERVSTGAAEALAGPDSALARRLVAALDHQPSEAGDLVRERAAWALSQTSGGRLIDPLLQALSAGDWRVRGYAAWALAAAPDPRATRRLMQQLTHPVWRLRAMAAYALHESADPQAAPAMEAALRDPAWQVRLEAVDYFSSLGASAFSQRLRPMLADRHVAVRLAAEHALTTP